MKVKRITILSCSCEYSRFCVQYYQIITIKGKGVYSFNAGGGSVPGFQAVSYLTVSWIGGCTQRRMPAE